MLKITDYIKDEIDEFQVFDEVTKLKKTGNVYRCCCPFHNEKTPSFTVYPPSVNQKYYSFYCFGCGKGGDSIKFIQLLNNLNSYSDAIKFIINKYGLKVNTDITEQTTQKRIVNDYLEHSNDVDLIPIDIINLKCSLILKYLKADESKYQWLDEQLNNRSLGEAQSLIREVMNDDCIH